MMVIQTYKHIWRTTICPLYKNKFFPPFCIFFGKTLQNVHDIQKKKQGQDYQEEAARRVEDRVSKPDTAREDGDGREVR